MSDERMSKRERYASIALGALIAEPQWTSPAGQCDSYNFAVRIVGETRAESFDPAELYARAAFILADAMVEASER